jgi:carbon monoxide dehydrogenase subunit G
MELEHSFTVPVPIDRAWDVLLDVERVAPCMPGATVTSVDGDEVHATVKVKVGPISMAYAGTARFVEKDKATWTVLLEASGKETRGAGTAAAKIRSELTDAGDETHVTVLTTLNVTGKPAQFGRGVMNEVSGKLLTIFATNLAALLAEPDGTAEPAAGAAGAETSAAPAVTPGAAAATAAAPGGGLPADHSEPIDELKLPARVASSLSREGLVTVGQLAARTQDELLAIDGIGPASVEDIKAKLTERGLALGQAPVIVTATAVGSPNGEHPLAASAGAAPTTPAGSSSVGSDRPAAATQDHEALNLIKVAGLPLLKRALPVLAGLLAAGLIAIWVRFRRRRSRG